MKELMPYGRYQLTGERLSPAQRLLASLRSVVSRALNNAFDKITPSDPLSMRGVVSFFPQDAVYDYLRRANGDKSQDPIDELRPTTAAPAQLIDARVKLPQDH